jgi:hypothetical protein
MVIMSDKDGFDSFVDILKQTKGVRTYTDEKGFHITTISEEKEKENKYGKKCDNCHKRNHWLILAEDEMNICKECYDKIWEQKDSYGHIVSMTTDCPFCSNTLIVNNINPYDDTKGVCKCGAIYHGGSDYDGNYEFRFLKRK